MSDIQIGKVMWLKISIVNKLIQFTGILIKIYENSYENLIKLVYL